MRHRSTKIAGLSAAVLVAGLAGSLALVAQPPPSIKRTVMLKQDMTIPDREVLMVNVDLPPGAVEGRHTHNAEVYAFVQEGTISLDNEGKPTVTLKAGDIFTIAPGKIHEAKNVGTGTARLAVVFVAEKGKALTTPVK
jgi:quercetin dioxygenase-like cupin family protein